MPQEKPKKAVVATVNYAGFEFPGLQMPDGTYGITASQAWEMLKFSEHPNHASRTLKRLLGKDFQTTRMLSELNPKKVNVILLKDFGLLVMKLAFRGNEVAQAIAESSVDITLEQAFDIAFDNKRSLEEYQEKQKARVQSKVTRRTLTDAIRDYVKLNGDDLSDNYKKYIYNNCTDRVYRLVFGRNAKQLREDLECVDVRAAMTIEELFIVRGVEDLAMKLVEQEEIEPQLAIDEAGKRLMITTKIDRGSSHE